MEKLKQEEEKKIATLTRENKHKFSGPTGTLITTNTTDENILNNNIDDDGNHFESSEHEDDEFYDNECKINRDLIIEQHRLISSEQDDDSNEMR